MTYERLINLIRQNLLLRAEFGKISIADMNAVLNNVSSTLDLKLVKTCDFCTTPCNNEHCSAKDV